MNNLYVFAIGGSGERIMYSMLMMMAAGMPINAHTVIPVFVDNDEKSNALDKCTKLIKYYRGPSKDGVGMHSLYADAELGDSAIPSFAQVNIAEPRMLNLAGDQIGNLNSIIGRINNDDSLERAIGEERDLLFTTDDLEMPLNVGFVGNPNIGTVVLNSLSFQVDDFQSIKSDISNNDGVIVLGSLFGGTGAAGFPLIINKFYTEDEAHCPLLGGVAVLPYFTLTDKDKTDGILDTDRWDVKSETFDTKTRAALMYYADYMKNMHYRYYVGDDRRRQYEHYVGGDKQKNPVNMIEVMAALSIFDFAKQSKPDNIVYKRPQWRFKDDEDASVSNVSGILNKDLKRALIKFQMLKSLFFESCFLKDDIAQARSHVENIGFSTKHLEACVNEGKINQYSQAWGLFHIFDEWDKWINDLRDEKAKRQLQLFDKSQAVTIDNITKLFFSDDADGLGIARMLTRREGSIFNRRTVIYPAKPDIAQQLTEAYRELYPRGSKNDAANITDNQRLGKLLQILSLALDKVIDKNCAI